ncbi:hypothetical protein NTE_00904 [Candidatus Nitrososphaera evergladensis SR1]|uniref:Uncharacterized protein n=1 Tax=Candidatus Nitrososphaera evergladensis SR1 TaxID=1459636 RepID=A0A075MP96_9ARCH|nr:hypothetical protein NTE_00904 [Candidatus Nitrososphaera evergladensis SR1]
MLTLLTKNKKVVQNTGMFFLVLGTSIHAFNVANLMTPGLSHTWSAIAIMGFVPTAGSQVGGKIRKQAANVRRRKRLYSKLSMLGSEDRNVVPLP